MFSPVTPVAYTASPFIIGLPEVFFTAIKRSSAVSAKTEYDAVVAVRANVAKSAIEDDCANEALSIVPCKKLAVNAYDDVATFPCIKDAVVAKLAESACVAESACIATDAVSALSACEALSAFNANDAVAGTLRACDAVMAMEAVTFMSVNTLPVAFCKNEPLCKTKS